MTLENLVTVKALWMNEQIEWKVRPRDGGIVRQLEAWIRKILREVKK